MLRELDLTAV